tara:strand:+ start:291 stop:701 length:411 start_codon:yes stop_codon:yes gene_type:complete
MTRSSKGAHGKPCMRVGGRVMMTIRPDPYILDDTDLAMVLGRHLGIKNDYWDAFGNEMTESRAINMIWAYELKNKLTQKYTLNVINDAYYLEQYNAGCSDNFEYYDQSGDTPHHEVLLRLIHRIWPQFKVAPTTNF